MNQKTIVFCGLISPIIYLLATFIGGALRPGYSHIINTVSELMAPGSPNKLLMHVLFTLSAILSVIFGIGVWQFVQGSDHADLAGQFAAGLLIAIGVVTILTSSIFPQDPQMDWDAPPTFAGQMHKIMAMGVLPVLSLLSIVLMGIWMNRSGLFSGFGTYSFITIGAVVISALITFATMNRPILGLTERITVIIIQQWTFVLALKIFLR